MAATVGVIVPAAGRGARFGSSENKIWATIGGRTVLEWTLSAFQSHAGIDTIVLVGASDEIPRLRDAAAAFEKVSVVIPGGATRAESVRNGVYALPAECDLVLVHDAARPLVTRRVINEVIDRTRRFGAAAVGFAVTDTLRTVGEDNLISGSVPREGLVAIQTPQGARVQDLKSAFEKLGDRAFGFTDETGILSASGFPVVLVEGDESNLKVTRQADLALAEAYLGKPKSEETIPEGQAPAVSAPDPSFISSTDPYGLHPSSFRRPSSFRTGFGYDVHAFADGRELWLGGVQIPHPRGLKGHSDADVLLHAVCDALLGAAAMGDIGVLFPDTDAAHKDRRSIEFVREVGGRLNESRWQIVNLDVTLLAEEPRIGPYREAMAAQIAAALRIGRAQINIKATTSEGIGSVGRKEGIACWAVATIAHKDE